MIDLVIVIVMIVGMIRVVLTKVDKLSVADFDQSVKTRLKR